MEALTPINQMKIESLPLIDLLAIGARLYITKYQLKSQKNLLT